MDFLIKWSLDTGSPLQKVGSYPELTNLARGVSFIANPQGKSTLQEYTRGMEKIYLIGDMVLNPGEVLSFETLSQMITKNQVFHRGGFFYLVYFAHDGHLSVYSSILNILPLYYYEQSGVVYVSSRTELIRRYSGMQFPVDKQYLLERLIFTYGMFNRTYWSGISLVPGNHYIHLDDKCKLIQTFDLADLFVSSPAKGKQILAQVADSFIDNTRKYFPDEKYAISFTGGFDGRTLLAASLYHEKDFCAYSFGSAVSSDLQLPLEQAGKLGVDFMPIYLEDEYVSKHSFQDALELINLTEGYASFSRAHYLYAAKILGNRFDYMITGNFGSELFRAAHVVGVMLSRELYQVVSCKDVSDIAGIIKTSPKLRYLQLPEYSREIDSLIMELVEFRRINASLADNRLLYKFTLTEILRKYFGPEIVMQRNFINNRAPYLDFRFIKFLMSTYYCGAYSDFNTHNPVKRFKGQVAYAHIIRKTAPALYDLKTNKGYRPSDLVSIGGKLALIQNLLEKKMKAKHKQADDSNSVDKAFTHNFAKYSRWQIYSYLYNSSLIQSCLSSPAKERDILFNLMSTNYYLHSTVKV